MLNQLEDEFSLSKIQLANAFIAYLSEPETHLDQLRIGVLSQLSNINRVTFYRNFSSMEDFLKWFLLKDLIFRANLEQPIDFEVAMDRLYDYVVQHRLVLRKMFASSFRTTLMHFIENESKTYQRLNIQRLDTEHVLDANHRIMMIDFYGHGISQLISHLIDDPLYESMEKQSFVAISKLIVKNYIEKTIQQLHSKNS